LSFLVIGVYGDNVFGPLLDGCLVALSDGLFRLTKKPVYLPLKALASHDWGMVIPP
jgi:hypothetical protein